MSAAASSASPRSASNEAISARVAPRWSNRPSRAARMTAATVGTAATAICADRGAERAVTSRSTSPKGAANTEPRESDR